MENSRDPMGPCVVGGCAAPGYVRYIPSDEARADASFCRAHLEQMLKETGLWDKPASRALREALEDNR